MPNTSDAQETAAKRAAEARGAIAKRIAALTPDVEDDATAQIVLHLAQAYSQLAAEPPRARGN
jgi:hypothetical protein